MPECGDNHSKKGPDDLPEYPDNGLFVAYGDIPPGQDQKKLPVAPEIGPVVFLRPAGLDDEDLFLHRGGG